MEMDQDHSEKGQAAQDVERMNPLVGGEGRRRDRVGRD
jgi:hypothetical protein